MTDRIPLMTATCFCGVRLVYRTLLSEHEGLDRLRIFHGDDGLVASMLFNFDEGSDEMAARTLISRTVQNMKRSKRSRPPCFEMWKAAINVYS